MKSSRSPITLLASSAGRVFAQLLGFTMPFTESASVMQDWPQPGTGNAGPVLRYGRGITKLAYDTADERVAVVVVPACLQVICGYPNDEVLHSHPLYGKGLTFYSVHQVQNSSRLAAMAKANSVHHRHDAASYLKGKEHWVFTFQDGTIEFLALSAGSNALSFSICNSWAEANALLAVSETQPCIYGLHGLPKESELRRGNG